MSSKTPRLKLCDDCGLPIPICNAKAMVRIAIEREGRQATIDAIAGLTAPQVKPLAWWSPSASNNYTHGAETIFGTYYVGIDGGRHNAWIELFHEGRRPIEQWFGEDRGHLEAAKSDAQKHYESRILSALE